MKFEYHEIVQGKLEHNLLEPPHLSSTTKLDSVPLPPQTPHNNTKLLKTVFRASPETIPSITDYNPT